MTERGYRIAGVEVKLIMPHDMMYENGRKLTAFEANTLEAPHIFRYERAEALDPPGGALVTAQPNIRQYTDAGERITYIGAVSRTWKDAFIRVSSRGKEHRVQVRNQMYGQRIGTNAVLESLSLEHLIAQNKGFLLHCSYIAHQGKAFLFTAPSETGKSTQADLWNRLRGAEIINGDRAAVRLSGNVLLAEGVPFSGSSRHCENRSLPVGAIVYLAKAHETSIRPMRGFEAFRGIWEGVSVNTWDKEDMETVSHLVQMAAQTIPMYYLPCTPDESAVIALEEALRKQICI